MNLPGRFPEGDRSKVRRMPKRGSQERADIYAILDSHILCHIAYVIEGQPYVTPTGYGATAIASIGMAHRPAGCCAARQAASRSA